MDIMCKSRYGKGAVSYTHLDVYKRQISSTLATRVKKQARQASQKAYYTEILMSSNKKLQQGHDDEEILDIGAKQLEALLGRPILYAISNGDNELDFAVEPKDKKEMLEKLTVEETAVAQWVRKNKMCIRDRN